MLVVALERAPPKLIGYCSSWALQIATGVYVANLPSRIREEIWDKIEEWSDEDTRAVMLWSTRDTEQGLKCYVLGSPRRRIVDREGLLISSWIPRIEPASDAPEQTP